MAGRYGGEEFIIVLSETDTKGAWMVANKIRSGVDELGIPRKDDYGTGVTVSVGTASVVPTPDKTPAWLIEQADRGLYQAKNTGRNKVCGSPSYSSPSSKKL
jgi:diguanylate cyclase (GGDEF)-like protein